MIVADASVALKWFVADEPLADEAASIIRSGTPVLAPDLVVAEGANAAWRWSRLGRIRPEEAQRIAAHLATLLPRETRVEKPVFALVTTPSLFGASPSPAR